MSLPGNRFGNRKLWVALGLLSFSLLILILWFPENRSTYAVQDAGPAGGFLTIGVFPKNARPRYVLRLSDGRFFAVGDQQVSVSESEQTQWRVFPLPKGQLKLPEESDIVGPPIELGDGRVLVGGVGEFLETKIGVLGLAIWNPSDGQWLLVKTDFEPRTRHSAVRLPDGRVLLIGGRAPSPAGTAISTVAGFDGASLTPFPGLNVARFDHTSALLPNGSVVVIGGVGIDGLPMTSVEILDTASRSWRRAPPLARARAGHVAVALPDGRILVAGGVGEGNEPLRSTEIFDPIAMTWAQDAPLLDPASRPLAVALANGDVLLIPSEYPVAQIWNARTRDWRPAGYFSTFSMTSPPIALPTGDAILFEGSAITRWKRISANDSPLTLFGFRSFTETRLLDGRWLLTGGYRDLNETRLAIDAAEIFDPASGRFQRTERMRQIHFGHKGVLLDDGRVLIADGKAYHLDRNRELVTPLAELWNPTTGRWTTPRIKLPDPRFRIYLGKLASGKVLFYALRIPKEVGEDDETPEEDSSQRAWIWDPGSDISNEISVLPEGAWRDVIILPDGKVLLVADQGGTSMLWNAFTGQALSVPKSPLGGVGNWHAVVMRNGQVLFLESHQRQYDYRFAPGTSRAFLLDLGSLKWGAIPDLPDLHLDGQGIAAMDDGALLIEALEAHYWFGSGDTTWRKAPPPPMPLSALRWNGNGELPLLHNDGTPAVFMDPITHTWTAKASTYIPRRTPALVPLNDGRLFVVGSDSSEPPTSLTQIWDPRDESWTFGPTLPEGYKKTQAVRMRSGRVVVVGMSDDHKRIVCEHWLPGETNWKRCGEWAALHVSSSNEFFVLDTLESGHAVLLYEADSALILDEASMYWRKAKLELHQEVHGMSKLPDGRWGHNGFPSGKLWDEATRDWIDITAVAERWIVDRGAIRLSDGRVLTSQRLLWNPSQRLWTALWKEKMGIGQFEDEPIAWGRRFADLPDGCVANGASPMQIVNPTATDYQAVKFAPIHIEDEQLAVLADGSVIVAGNEFVRLKVSCDGIEVIGKADDYLLGRRWQISFPPANVSKGAGVADRGNTGN